MKQITASIISNREILPGMVRPGTRTTLGTYLTWLNCPEIASEARPGQFVMVRCGEECILPRPLSIHQINSQGDMALLFTVWEDGKGTPWLSQRKVNTSIELLGPLGNGFSIKPGAKKLLLMAGGIGIAPLYFLAQEAISREYSVILLLGARTESQLYPEKLLPAGIKLVTATEDGTAGKTGRVNELLPEFIDWADQIFACGPMPMYRDITAKYTHLLADKSIQISLEMRMACGIGVCYGCTIKTKSGLKQVCKDGPVFELNEICWDELNLAAGGA